jgi:CBS domain-containing protein
MRARSTTVDSYCVRNVVTATRETPVARCAQLMHDEHVGGLVIVDERGGQSIPVGMITDRDIAIEVVAFGVDAQTLTAGDIMAGELAVARDDEDLLSVLATMREHGVRRLPVVGADGSLMGIVTADNLWEVLAEEVDGLARVVRAGQTRERKTRIAGALQAAPG